VRPPSISEDTIRFAALPPRELLLGLLRSSDRIVGEGRSIRIRPPPVGVGARGSYLQTQRFVDSSLTISARRRKHLAYLTGLFGKQTRSAVMKTMLISAASLIFISGTALARVVAISPTVPFHGASAPAEHRTVRLEGPAREGGVLCTTKYITITRVDGNSETHKSVNCEE
jgi:hypothetical protein